MSRRSGILEFAILGLLREAPMHGYELRKRLNTSLGVFRAFSYGSLYPCLKTLVAQGWLTEEQGGDPDDPRGAPLSGRRARIVYRLTEAGHQHLHGMLDEVTPAACDDESFGVYFALFGHARSDLRLRILHGRRDRLLEIQMLSRRQYIDARGRMKRGR